MHVDVHVPQSVRLRIGMDLVWSGQAHLFIRLFLSYVSTHMGIYEHGYVHAYHEHVM